MNKVYPGDLFNDSNLLFQYGKLYIGLADNGLLHHWIETEENYNIFIDENTGGSYLAGIAITVDDIPIFRSVNSRKKYNLYTDIGEDTIYLFNDNGELTNEFLEYLKERKDEWLQI